MDYISDDNIDAAVRLLNAIEKAILADRRHRFYLVYSYLIVYRWETSLVEVIRVLHAARDVQGILSLAQED